MIIYVKMKFCYRLIFIDTNKLINFVFKLK